MEKKFYIFKNPEWAKSKKLFTHYWTNEGENYFDTVNQEYNYITGIHKESEFNGNPTEAYLQQFKDVGYSWIPLDSTRYQRSDISEITVQMSELDWNENPTLFFKIVNEDHGIETDIPLYYYSYAVTEASDQNYPTTSYTIKCKLDMWATYWCRMHSILKSLDTDVEFMQKMCDRFIFHPAEYDSKGERVRTQGFIIDYLNQPYLMRTKDYSFPLIVNDNRENFLTLEDWLFINSGSFYTQNKIDWLEDTWMLWLKNPYIGFITPKKTSEIITGLPMFTPYDLNKLQNSACLKLSDGFYDTDFNSNSKYRYLACKVGNNTLPQLKDSSWAEGMFENNNFNCLKYTPENNVSASEIKAGYWTKIDNSGTYVKDIKLTMPASFVLDPGEVCISWNDWLLKDKSIVISLIDKYMNVYSILWTDDLQLKEHRKVLNKYVLGKEYEILSLPTKSYSFDIYGDTINVSLGIFIRFDSATECHLVFKLKIENAIDEVISLLDVKVQNDYDVLINQFAISQTGTISEPIPKHLTGETIMLIPFKKGDKGLEYIKALNDFQNSKIYMGDGSVLGMPINDIPPSVLALAMRRQNDESDWQTIGDILSIRHKLDTDFGEIDCPLDLVGLETGNNIIPAIFTSFDSVPITMATAPLQDNIYQCVGGNKFFNYFYEILTRDYLTTNNWEYSKELEEWVLISGGNTIEVEPFLYSPQFWKWSYFIDGSHYLELTAEKLDFKKLLEKQDWQVKLNVSISSSTNYFLDISEIKNNKYPMSKLGVELISGDQSTFPYTTEAYQNYIQTNIATKDTSQNAKDIANRYARTGAIISATTEGIATAATLTAQASAGGFFSRFVGLGVGAGLGAVAGGAKAAGIMLGAENAIKQANEEWDNKWRGELANYYAEPTSLNPNGLQSGSLIYSTIGKSNQNSYELFRTFSLSDIDKNYVWYDISLNGYPYLSKCKYNKYNNRVNFNVVNCNLFDKYYFISNYLQSKMFNISPLLSQPDAIISFMDKCKGLIRVFKCVYDESKMDEIIATNIELEREWTDAYFPPRRMLRIDYSRNVSDIQDDDWKWVGTDGHYEWIKDMSGTENNTFILTRKQDDKSYDIDVPYSDLYVNNWDELSKNYPFITLNNKNSFAAITTNTKLITDSITTNSAEYGPMIIESVLNTPTEIKSLADNSYQLNCVSVVIDTPEKVTEYKAKNHEIGWRLKLIDAGTSLKINCVPYCKWTFIEPKSVGDITVGEVTSHFQDVVNQSVDFNSSKQSSESGVLDVFAFPCVWGRHIKDNFHIKMHLEFGIVSDLQTRTEIFNFDGLYKDFKTTKFEFSKEETKDRRKDIMGYSFSIKKYNLEFTGEMGIVIVGSANDTMVTVSEEGIPFLSGLIKIGLNKNSKIIIDEQEEKDNKWYMYDNVNQIIFVMKDEKNSKLVSKKED